MRRGGLAVLVAAVVAALVVAIGAVVVERTVGSEDGPGGPGTETVIIQAPRGRILDRTGKVLVEDATRLEVRADVDVVAALGSLARSELLDALTVELAPGSAAVLVDALAADHDVAVLASPAPEDVRQVIEGDPERFPGITVVPVSARTYRYGALAAHLLGYSGRITADELEQRSDEDLPEDAIVGRAGVEAAMDRELRGAPGRIVYEVDATGHRVRELLDQREEPEPGRDVYLTIDIDLQYLAEKGLAAEVERRRGVQDNGCFLPGGCDPTGAASVALDPRNGQVLAMASYPTYDPDLFVGGISAEDYDAISDPDRGDEHDFPLLNRAIGGQYVPGATLKPFTAHAGLAAELITPDERFNDTGVYRYSADCPIEVESNCSAQNAGATPHGAVDLTDALRVSSDTYFYALGDESWRARDRLGEEALQDGVVEWGFGEETGIEVVGEAAGRVPTPDWLRDVSDQLNGDDPELAEEAGIWTAGVSGNVAVGQGDTLVSPIQLASAYATLANGGTIWRPQLVLQTTASGAGDDVEVVEPDETGAVDLPPEWRDPIVAGLDGVTKGPGGTATTAFQGFDQSTCPVMGKTGTAQVTGRNDTSLFAAVAPTPTEGRPSVIAMATVVAEAGFGAAVAVPVTRRVLEPFAAAGCDVEAFGAADTPYEAPLGGAFDVAEAIAEYVPPVAATRD